MDNHKLVQVQSALQRLDQMLGRLESAAGTAATAVAERKNLEAKFDGLNHAHTSLKETSGRVAGRLDAAIHRLTAALQD